LIDIGRTGHVFMNGTIIVGSGFDGTVIDEVFQELFPFSPPGDKYETFFKNLSFELSDNEMMISALLMPKHQATDVNSHIILSFSSRAGRSFITQTP
jgi:hypothetical protein